MEAKQKGKNTISTKFFSPKVNSKKKVQDSIESSSCQNKKLSDEKRKEQDSSQKGTVSHVNNEPNIHKKVSSAKEAVESINGMSIEDVIHKITNMERELTQKRSQLNEYADDYLAIRKIVYPMLEKHYYLNRDISLEIVNKNGVNPEIKEFQFNIDSPRKILEALEWIQHCHQPSENEMLLQVKLSESGKKNLSKDLEKVKDEKEKILMGFKTKFEELIHEKDELEKQNKDILTEKEIIILEKQKMEEKYKKIIMEKEEEIFKVKQQPIRSVSKQKVKVIASKQLLQELTLEEIKQLLENKKQEFANNQTDFDSSKIDTKLVINAKVDEFDSIQDGVKTCDKSIPIVPVIEEEIVSIEQTAEKTPTTMNEIEEEIILPTDEKIEMNNESVSEAEGIKDAFEETLEFEQINDFEGDNGFEEMEIPNEVEELLASIKLENQQNVEEVAEEEDIIDADVPQEALNAEYVNYLKEKKYDIEFLANDAYDVLVNKDGEEKIPLIYIYYDIDKMEYFDNVMKKTDKIHFIFKDKQLLNEGNKKFCSWLFKNKTRRHKIRFSFNTLDELKVSGLDKLDKL